MAGGLGFCTPQGFHFDLHPGSTGDPLVLTALPAYGLAIRIREPGGEWPRLGSGLGGKWWGTPAPLARGATALMSGDWTAALLDVEHPPSGTPFDRVSYFLCPEDEGDTIDVRFDLHWPGYEASSDRLRARRAIGSLGVEEVRITPSALGFGALTVWCEPVEALEAVLPLESGRSPAELHLVEMEGEQREIRVALPELERGYQRIDGLPFGVYAARFRASHQLFRQPPSTDPPLVLRVGEVESDFRVRLDGLGSLELVLEDPAGAGLAGAVSGTHTRSVGGETDAFHFDSPPYVIPMLPRGDYTISVFAGGEVQGAEFRVIAGERTRLRLVLQ